MSANAALAERLSGRFEIDADTGCWVWNRARNVHGYGAIGIDNKVKRAHRVAWQAYVGDIPDGMAVLHRCDNPPCINPDHLYLGTKADNSLDMVRKGRSAAGERHSQARLSEAQVSEIRALHAAGMTQSEIARRFVVSSGYVSQVVNGLLRGRRA